MSAEDGICDFGWATEEDTEDPISHYCMEEFGHETETPHQCFCGAIPGEA